MAQNVLNVRLDFLRVEFTQTINFYYSLTQLNESYIDLSRFNLFQIEKKRLSNSLNNM